MKYGVNEYQELILTALSKYPDYMSKSLVVKSKMRNKSIISFSIPGLIDEKIPPVLMVLKALHVYAFVNVMYWGLIYQGHSADDLKPDKDYYIELGISGNNIDLVRKEGFGLLFYNINHLTNVVVGTLLEIGYFLNEKMSNVDQDIVKKLQDYFMRNVDQVKDIDSFKLGFINENVKFFKSFNE
jgi:hypothetical protein